MYPTIASFKPPSLVFSFELTLGAPRCSTRGTIDSTKAVFPHAFDGWDVAKDAVHGNPLARTTGRLAKSGTTLAGPVTTLAESNSRARRPNLDDDDMVVQVNPHPRHRLFVILSPASGAPVEHTPSGQDSSWMWSWSSWSSWS